MKLTTKHSVLKTENLHIGYRYKHKETLIASGVNLAIKKGELVAVIGINGAGKSTLLKTLTKNQAPLGGAVFLNNLPLSDFSNKTLSQTISVVLTNQVFSKNLSVFELVALGRQPYTNWLGRLSEHDMKQVQFALEQVGLTELSQKKCDELSDGQLQKTMIARALAQDTSLIFMDEPTTHLDIYHKAYVLQLLKKLTHETQKAIVFASHEINLALQLCDKIILINKGEIISGSPKELVQEGVFETLFPEKTIQFHPGTKSFHIKN